MIHAAFRCGKQGDNHICKLFQLPCNFICDMQEIEYVPEEELGLQDEEDDLEDYGAGSPGSPSRVEDHDEVLADHSRLDWPQTHAGLYCTGCIRSGLSLCDAFPLTSGRKVESYFPLPCLPCLWTSIDAIASMSSARTLVHRPVG